MALYRVEFKVYGRRSGASAVHAAAYRSGGRGSNTGSVETKSVLGVAAYRAAAVLRDERTGERFDYSRKQHIEWSGIMAPDHAPAWAHDRQKLWNALEARETRKDAQLAREALLTLPRELTPAQRRALVQAYVRDHFVSQGMVADISIHNPDASDGGEQPHAHVLLTMRDIGPEGFGLKRRDWNQVHWASNTAMQDGFLRNRRATWEEYVNAALEEAGSAARVDRRSLKERGIDQKPQPKEGKARHAKPGRAWVDDRRGLVMDVSAYNSAIRSGLAVARKVLRVSQKSPEIMVQSLVEGMVNMVLHNPPPGRAPDPDLASFYGWHQTYKLTG